MQQVELCTMSAYYHGKVCHKTKMKSDTMSNEWRLSIFLINWKILWLVTINFYFSWLQIENNLNSNFQNGWQIRQTKVEPAPFILNWMTASYLSPGYLVSHCSIGERGNYNHCPKQTRDEMLDRRFHLHPDQAFPPCHIVQPKLDELKAQS